MEANGGPRPWADPDLWRSAVASPRAAFAARRSARATDVTAQHLLPTTADTRRHPRPGERTLAIAVVVTLLMVVAGVGALVALHPGATATSRSASGTVPSKVRSPATTASTTTTTASTTTTTSPGGQAPAGVTAAMSGGFNPVSIVDPSPVAAAVVSSLPLYASPGAVTPEAKLPNPNWLGAPLVLLVTGYKAGWVQGYVPMRPNETTAWFPASDVTISADPYHIEVSISAHQLVLYKDNAPIFSSEVATGAPDSPTPTGSYFVTFVVKLTDPQDAYGPYALGTSAFSNTYYSFEGGPGVIGIHGTNQPWVIGSYASHGCIRLPNDAITTVATQVPPGTPVEISS
jgi:lipoprotein-anchoring transpeptidase ErfK/SrfK